MTDEREPQGSIPALYGRRPYEIQSQEHYPIDTFDGGAEGLDPRRLLASLWRWKWWIAACTSLGVLGGVLAGRFIEPEYQVTSSIWIEQEDRAGGPFGGFEPLAAEGWSSVLASNTVLRSVVEETKLWLRLDDVDSNAADAYSGFELTDDALMGSYALEVGRNGAYELTRRDTTAVETGTLGGPVGASFGFDWSPPAESFRPGARERFNVRSVDAATQGLRQRLDVRFDDKAGIIYTTLLWKDRVEGAYVVNTTQDVFLQTAADLKNRELKETADILSEQTRQAEERLRTTELALEQHKVRTITLPSEGISVAPTTFAASCVFVYNWVRADRSRWPLATRYSTHTSSGRSSRARSRQSFGSSRGSTTTQWPGAALTYLACRPCHLPAGTRRSRPRSRS